MYDNLLFLVNLYMNTFRNDVAVFVSEVVTFRFRKKRVLAFYLGLIALIVYALFFRGNDSAIPEPIVTDSEVKVALVRNLLSGNSFTAVGTVSAVSEAKLQTEASGRVTAVTVALGDTVRAGTILARLESASESATLLQAQGAYEAALAGTARGNIGLNEAENGKRAAQNAAISTYKNAYTTVSGIVYSTIDQFFSNPNDQIPGVRLNDTNTSFLNTERVKLRSVLPAWQNKSLTLNNNDDLAQALSEAETTTKQVLAIVDEFIVALNNGNPNTQYTKEDYRTLGVTFNGVRTQLVGILSNIDNTRTNLRAADENLKSAQISSSGSTISSADAQVKIALGSLRAAQANFEKTLVRTPITGVVNALYLKVGDYASLGIPAAIIANKSSGLEIATAVSQEDSVKLAIGDTVTINDTATGTISAIAGAIDPTTGKVALKVSVNENTSLQNGSTVSVQFTTDTSKEITEIIIPLSSVKMTGSGPVVFTVTDSKLVANPVTLGAISGENVVITAGITPDTTIVVDARGLKAGEIVTVTNN